MAAFVLGYYLIRFAQVATLLLLAVWAWLRTDGGAGITLPLPGFVFWGVAGVTVFAWLTLMIDFPLSSTPSIYLIASAAVTAALAVATTRIPAKRAPRDEPETLP